MEEIGKRRILIEEKAVQQRVRELGRELAENYRHDKPLVVGLLRGGFIFLADLVRAMDIPLEVEFMTTSSYGHDKESSGTVEIVQDVRAQVKGRKVLAVDDIMDSGHTIARVKEHLLEKGAASVEICVLLDKPSRRQIAVEPDYVAFEIPDVFIVGCGLDYEDYYRNVPYVYTYDED